MLRTRPARWFSGLFILTALTASGDAEAGGSLFDEQSGALDVQACEGSGCWTNHMLLADLDGDADLDIVFTNYSGFFDVGAAQLLAIYENDGAGNFSLVSETALGGHAGKHRQVAVGDIDADGDLDIFAPAARDGGSALFVNAGEMVFADEYSERMPAEEPNVGATRMGDFDNDGDLDIFSADGYTSSPGVFGHIYINDGLGSFEELDGAIPPTFTGEDPDDVDLLDANGDFVLDIMLNAHSGSNALWLGNGDGTFSDASDDLVDQPGGYHYNPAACDVDGDGDLDIWIDNMGPGYSEQLLINAGDGTFTDETNSRVSGNGDDDDNGVVCADIDNDGDMDAVVLNVFGAVERLFENDGDGGFEFRAGTFPTNGNGPGSLWGEFGDLNGDGRLDLVTGNGEPSDRENEVFFANGGVPVDDLAPAFRGLEDVGEVGATFSVRFAVVDGSVTDTGPRLQSVGGTLTGDGVEESVDATFSGGDLYRVAFEGIAAGSYTVEVCATDVAGNEACESSQLEVTDGGGGETGSSETGAADETGAASASESDTASASDSASASASASDSNASESASASASAGATASETDGDTDGDSAGGNSGGGGCSTGGPAPLSLLLLGPVLLGLRRRRG